MTEDPTGKRSLLRFAKSMQGAGQRQLHQVGVKQFVQVKGMTMEAVGAVDPQPTFDWTSSPNVLAGQCSKIIIRSINCWDVESESDRISYSDGT